MTKPFEYHRIELIKSIVNEVPPELGLSSIEFEGPSIVVYIRNRKALVKHLDLVRNIAKKVRKRIVLRVVEEERLPPSEAKKKILEIVPKDAGVDPNGIEFDEAFGDVWIRAEKAGLIISRGHYLRHYILAETGWRPVPRRAAPLESKFSSMIFTTLLKNQKYRLMMLALSGVSLLPLGDTMRMSDAL
ncbi:MAG: beta-CASP ribonuclease aCPSF1, partial [Desulfurococcaceae archaeon]